MVIKRISTKGIDFHGGDSIPFTRNSTDASLASAVSAKIEKAVVYLHKDGLGEVDGVHMRMDGKKPPEKWWEPEEVIL